MPASSWVYEGQTALITDASSDLGIAFAEALARRGAHLILAAPGSADALQTLAARLSRLHVVQVDVLVADLSQEGTAQAVYDAVQQRALAVDLLINNAEIAARGHFEMGTPAQIYQQVMLNALAVADLTHVFLPRMIARGRGAVLNVASLAAFQPLPTLAVYAATKAFVLSLSQALWAECRQHGVRVLALCPSALDTVCFETLKPHPVAIGLSSTPEFVVTKALQALERDRSVVVPGLLNVLLARFVWRPWPMDLLVRLTERLLHWPRTRRGAEAVAVQPAQRC